jgi:DNA-directed RNA polymerase subunit M/transcription elongation factor TFIIS
MHSPLSAAQSTCVDHRCPECGTREHVTAERVIQGELVLTRCLCRACGHTWHLEVQPISHRS